MPKVSISILSLFPEYFQSPLKLSILGKAQERGLLEIEQIDIRTFSKDKHKRVDDRPFGGGPGMVLTPQPVVDAIRKTKREDSYVIFLSPQGKLLTAALAENLAKRPHLILLAGHYEGIDERIIEKEVDEEISIGDYVLTNGCLAALVLIDVVSRFIPGVLGHPDGAKEDSFQEGIFDAPQYTRPEEFEGLKVPEILKGGNHEKIRKWRKEKSLEKTRKVRPELYEGYCKKNAKP